MNKAQRAHKVRKAREYASERQRSVQFFISELHSLGVTHNTQGDLIEALTYGELKQLLAVKRLVL